ncbi:integrase family protein [Microvirga lotononidis]|uniref:Integrase family protein n=1 Tax=Microvirga lotononidis TaxID=864069 RepID=I4Z341_9HYPH|nr:integrase family protein [Microvirga lotononidis]
MRRAEIWAAFYNALAVVMTIVVIAALFYSLPARAEEGHSDEHQIAHGAYHHLYNGIMRPDVKNSSCCSEQGRPAPNHKRVYRVMKAHDLLLQRHAGGAETRWHDGRVAVERSSLRWCSDRFEIGCANGETVRVAFALDCCDREVLGHVATTEGLTGEDVQDLMITAVEPRFGSVNRLPETIEGLSDNGSGDIAHDTKSLAREMGLEPRTTPVQSPHSNGLAEAFVRTITRDDVRVNPIPDARTVMESLPLWFEHDNSLHPHKALGDRSPREFIASRQPG